MFNALPQVGCHPKRISKKERFWLEVHKKSVEGYEGIPGHDAPLKLDGKINALQKCVTNHTCCVDL
jgi:hypothetical protein